MIPEMKGLPPLGPGEQRIGYREPGINPWIIIAIVALLALLVWYYMYKHPANNQKAFPKLPKDLIIYT